MADLSKIGDRDRLKSLPGDEPHWQRLRAGCFVGYRPSKRSGRGSWFARAYDATSKKYARNALGSYGALTGNEVFAAAKKDAEAWADRIECRDLRSEKVVTVADACKAYLADKPGSIAEGVFRRHVLSDPIATIRLDRLRRLHLLEWRKRLENAPAFVSRNKVGEKRTKRRSDSTINRDMVPLRAAIGRVLSPGTPNSEAAWQEALKPRKGAGKRRSLYLDRDQRKQLLAATDSEAVPFVRALCILPLRPGALASLVAGDYEQLTRTLTVGKDKHGRPRQITVPPAIGKFLAHQLDRKLPVAPMFNRADGRPWNKDAWKIPIKAAVQAANLPSDTAAYTLRHSVITDLVRDGLPVLTVAQISGTSIAMIEQHYGNLIRDDAEQALSRLEI